MRSNGIRRGLGQERCEREILERREKISIACGRAGDQRTETFSEFLGAGSRLASANRQYLRMHRGKHAFDICAAPFGNGFFVSWWLTEPPLRFGFPPSRLQDERLPVL